MKKNILFLVLAFMLAFSSCSKGEDNHNDFLLENTTWLCIENQITMQFTSAKEVKVESDLWADRYGTYIQNEKSIKFFDLWALISITPYDFKSATLSDYGTNMKVKCVDKNNGEEKELTFVKEVSK